MAAGIFAILAKLLVAYASVYVMFVTLILVSVASPQHVFVLGPFVFAIAVVLAISGVVSAVNRKAGPFLWGVSACVLAAVFFAISGIPSLTPPPFVIANTALYLAPFSLAAVVNFIYRNRFTESLLAALPAWSGAWLLLVWVYTPLLAFWAQYHHLGSDPLHSLEQAATSAVRSWSVAALAVPPLLLYVLGKHFHVSAWRNLRQFVAQKGLRRGA